MHAQEHLNRVYQAQSSQELLQAYDDWAASYDQDLVCGMGWNKPARVGQALLPWLAPPATGPQILDVGAGTGLVGEFLASQGYDQITAVDFCAAMLARARQRGVYRQLLQLDLQQRLPLSDGSYDAVTAVGIFTEGHLGPDCMAELCRLVKPGGHLAFSLRDDLQPLYAQVQEELPWRLLQQVSFREGLESRPWSAWIYRVREPLE